MNTELIQQGVRLILEGVGEDVTREGLLDTPLRVARMYEELLSGASEGPEEIFKKSLSEQHGEMVLVKDIPVYSLCEHHMLPFFGKAHVGYIPGSSGQTCEISKIARLVDLYAKRLQVQERLTSQIADTFAEKINPQGVIVIIEAEHLCMGMRGIKKPGACTTTSAVRGVFKHLQATRAEAMSLILSGKC